MVLEGICYQMDIDNGGSKELGDNRNIFHTIVNERTGKSSNRNAKLQTIGQQYVS